MNKIKTGLLAAVILFAGFSFATNLSAKGSGSIWTTKDDCGTSTQDENHYAVGEDVYINGSNFDADDYDWSITGTPGSEDPDIVVASGVQAVDETGEFCFFAYTVENGDDGEYKVDFGGKKDNYGVDGETTPEPSIYGGLIIEKTVSGGTSTPANFDFFVDEDEVELNTEIMLEQGSYSVTEAINSGSDEYEATFGGSCDSEGTVTVSVGATTTCTILNTFTGTTTPGGNGTSTPPTGTSTPPTENGTSTPPDNGTSTPPREEGEDDNNGGGGGSSSSSRRRSSGGSDEGEVLGVDTTSEVLAAETVIPVGAPNAGGGGIKMCVL